MATVALASLARGGGGPEQPTFYKSLGVDDIKNNYLTEDGKFNAKGVGGGTNNLQLNKTVDSYNSMIIRDGRVLDNRNGGVIGFSANRIQYDKDYSYNVGRQAAAPSSIFTDTNPTEGLNLASSVYAKGVHPSSKTSLSSANFLIAKYGRDYLQENVTHKQQRQALGLDLEVDPDLETRYVAGASGAGDFEVDAQGRGINFEGSRQFWRVSHNDAGDKGYFGDSETSSESSITTPSSEGDAASSVRTRALNRRGNLTDREILGGDPIRRDRSHRLLVPEATNGLLGG